MNYKALLIKEDMTLSVEDINREDFCEDVHKLLGGFFEIVRPMFHLPRPFVLLVDDCGVLKDLPINPLASLMYGSGICGPALVMAEGMTDDGPDIIGLKAAEIGRVLSTLRSMLGICETAGEDDDAADEFIEEVSR